MNNSSAPTTRNDDSSGDGSLAAIKLEKSISNISDSTERRDLLISILNIKSEDSQGNSHAMMNGPTPTSPVPIKAKEKKSPFAVVDTAPPAVVMSTAVGPLLNTPLFELSSGLSSGKEVVQMGIGGIGGHTLVTHEMSQHLLNLENHGAVRGSSCLGSSGLGGRGLDTSHTHFADTAGGTNRLTVARDRERDVFFCAMIVDDQKNHPTSASARDPGNDFFAGMILDDQKNHGHPIGNRPANTATASTSYSPPPVRDALLSIAVPAPHRTLPLLPLPLHQIHQT